eukprot:m.57615 g.57615  ORF g.57615 m.57615 type:complete len:203 (+) comp7776_c0_seq2:379-987(+)
MCLYGHARVYIHTCVMLCSLSSCPPTHAGDDMDPSTTTTTTSSSGSLPDTTPEERAAAAAMRSSQGGAHAATEVSKNDDNPHGVNVMKDLPAVDIGVGRFKYVLIEVAAPDGRKRHLVRGVPGAAYHMDAARPTVDILEAARARYTVLGGGRIEHDVSAKTIHIYGHSYGFPWQGNFRHDISQSVCQSAYPGYTVTWSNDGY